MSIIEIPEYCPFSKLIWKANETFKKLEELNKEYSPDMSYSQCEEWEEKVRECAHSLAFAIEQYGINAKYTRDIDERDDFQRL